MQRRDTHLGCLAVFHWSYITRGAREQNQEPPMGHGPVVTDKKRRERDWWRLTEVPDRTILSLLRLLRNEAGAPEVA